MAVTLKDTVEMVESADESRLVITDSLFGKELFWRDMGYWTHK
jgi:hypothetical protein